MLRYDMFLKYCIAFLTKCKRPYLFLVYNVPEEKNTSFGVYDDFYFTDELIAEL